MADPNRRTDIIQAAGKLFAEHGYHKATIKQIAAEANLKSSALIYWYFENKEALLTAVLTSNIQLSEIADVPEQIFQHPPEVVLPQLLHMHVSLLDNPEMRKVVRIVVPEAMRNKTLSDQLAKAINPVFDMIQAYLQQQIENGRFRPHDTAISTRSLIAITVFYALNQVMLPKVGAELPEKGTYIAEAVKIFIRGLENGD